MALLSQNEIQQIVDAAVQSGTNPYFNRPVLVQQMDPYYLGLLPAGGAPIPQMLMDLGMMNQTERLASGQVPLSIYLKNLSLLMAATEQQKLILTMLDHIDHRSSGAPRIDPASVAQIKEKIIHVDDMVTFRFMEEGLKAAAGVLKLRIPRYENEQLVLRNGNPVMYLGTGWLLTPSLVMTNHHVINARDEGDAPAGAKDLQAQASHAEAFLDFNADNIEGTKVVVKSLEGAHEELDYAVLRIADTGRPGLRRSQTILQKGKDPTPVNIIQHPRGTGKRYAIRNNLVDASTTTDLRYFTDTDGGSSGSPVFNDRWEVVALHRAALPVAGEFQGRSTAWVNLGVHIVSVLKDIAQRYPKLAAEIGP